jgi:hypothetical protein
VELGATEVLALDVLREFPNRWLRPAIGLLRAVFGRNKPLPSHVKLVAIAPSQRLGNLRDTIRWKPENIERWLALGALDIRNHFRPDMF